jgi:hypothetical protein
MMPLVLIFALTIAGCFIFPWWWAALAAMSVGFFMVRGRAAFRDGFLGAAIAWTLRAAVLDWRNHGLLAGRVAEIFHLPGSAWLYVITAVIGGVAGGLGGWTGQALGSTLRHRRGKIR